jgi:hypothetical protein
MNQATPQLLSLAGSLITQETSRKSCRVSALATIHVVEKLRPHLANLMGRGGFWALLARALALASAEVPWLRAVKLNEDGRFDGLDTLHAEIEPAEFLQGKIVVLAQLIGLLVAMIGPDLTASLVADVCPELRSTITLWAKQCGAT